MITFKNADKTKLAIFCLFFIELLLFYEYYRREIYPYHPEGWDQVGYYNNSFRYFYYFLQRNWHGFYDNFLPQGILLQLTVAFSYLFFGISKFNGPIIIFFIWLFCQYKLIDFFSGQMGRMFALMMLGLFLSTYSYHHIVGGLVDFRLDVAGGILYGISLMYLIESQRLTNKKNFNYFLISALTGILVRTNLLVVYIPVMFFYSLFLLMKKQFKPLLWVSYINKFVKGYIVAVILFIFAIKDKFYMYYIGPIFNQENNNLVKTMHEAMRVNPNEWWKFYSYYLTNFTKAHLGAIFIILLITILLIIGFYGIYIFIKNKKNHSEIESTCDFKNLFIVTIIYLIIPFILYTANDSKNPVVATTLVIPFLILIGGVLSLIINYLNQNFKMVISKIGVVCLIVGFINYFMFTSSTREFFINIKGPEMVAREINKSVFELNFNDIKLSLLDFNELNGSLLEYHGFLQYNRLIKYEKLLPHGYELPTSEKIIESVSNSDIVIDNFKPGGKKFLPVSFNKNIEHYRQIALPIIRKDFIRLGSEYNTDWGTYHIYFKPRVILDNNYDDWLGQEFYIRVPDIFLGKIKKVSIEGSDQTYSNKKNIFFDIYFFGTDSEKFIQQSKIFPQYQNGKYIINIDFPSNEIVYVKIRASESFNPSKLGINKDTRELVFLYPNIIKTEKK